MQVDSIAELHARLVTLTAGGGRRILGLVGPPGAGKSTLARELAAPLAECAAIVPMDGFHLANAELARLGRSDRKGAPDTFDSAGYIALLRRLRDQPDHEIVYAPEFRREFEESFAGAIAILPEHRLVITEGNYLLLPTGNWPAARELIDEIWYVDIDPAVRVERLIARHMRFGRDAAAAGAWVARSDERNAELIVATRNRADVVAHLTS